MTAWVVAPGVGETGWFSLLYPPRPTALPPGATEESPAILPGIPYISQITPFLNFCKFPILSLTTSMCQINHRKWRFLNAGLDCIRNQAGHRTQESSVGFLNVRGQGGGGRRYPLRAVANQNQHLNILVFHSCSCYLLHAFI